ncbi:hypothetical protein phytr_1420 [Candidatus Phycorickettsia trachydisci]|uniref:Uncharacterized protein n=1 Tax=Candidatus Phycorickettsia trachydisci TaxID=2115978 RepID=A0A2P1P760_9RICK|nr:hypothetical protein phytr_1420 [Candidatus Phycorickettsia trachydisci]
MLLRDLGFSVILLIHFSLNSLLSIVRMIQKKQIIGSDNNVSTFENFAILMAA